MANPLEASGLRQQDEAEREQSEYQQGLFFIKLFLISRRVASLITACSPKLLGGSAEMRCENSFKMGNL
jgi:hypothetical protein